MKNVIVLLVLAACSGCASHPAWRATGIALGAALVAGSQRSSSSPSAPTDQRVPGNPCSTNPAVCR